MAEPLVDPTPSKLDPPIIKIDSNGDVLLFLQRELKLLVSSKILSIVSPPFAAMLSDRYLEGQRSDGFTIPEIELPADDAIGTFRIISLIHHRQLDTEPTRPTEFLTMALLGQKYMCTAAIQYPLSEFLDEYLSDPKNDFLTRYIRYSDIKDLLDLLCVAYLTSAIRSFRKISATIVFAQAMEVAVFSGPHPEIEAVLTATVLGKLFFLPYLKEISRLSNFIVALERQKNVTHQRIYAELKNAGGDLSESKVKWPMASTYYTNTERCEANT